MTSRDTDESGFDEECSKRIDAKDCPDCGGFILTDGGERRCEECGLIVDEYWIDHGHEGYTAPSAKGRTERTGAPLTPARHDRGLSSEIGRWVDGRGNALSHSKRRQLGRLRIQQNRGRWRSKAERNLADGFREIGRICGAIDTPRSVRDRACTLYRAAQRENLILGRSIEAMAAASVYAACRSDGCLRTLEELLEATEASRSKLLGAYQVLNEELGIATMPARPRDYVPRIAAACAVPRRLHERALELATVAESSGIANGRKPSGVAAACLYAAGRDCGVGLTQAEVAAVANVTEVTIRKRFYELLAERSQTDAASVVDRA